MFCDNLYLSQKSFRSDKLQRFTEFGIVNHIQGCLEEGGGRGRGIGPGLRGLGGLIEFRFKNGIDQVCLKIVKSFKRDKKTARSFLRCILS